MEYSQIVIKFEDRISEDQMLEIQSFLSHILEENLSDCIEIKDIEAN